MTRSNAVIDALSRTYPERTSLFILGTLTTALLILDYIAFVIPNASYTEIHLNDVFGLIDAAYRTFWGQTPSIDFQSLYGAAIYYPAALGFYLDFDAGGVLGFGHFVTAAPLLIIATLTSYRRFSVLNSAILILFLFLLIVVPMKTGGDFYDLSYANYYTRHGWAALTMVLLFYLEPRTIRRTDILLDSITITLLLLFLFYVKITFAVVALAFVAINSITSRYKMRLSLVSLSLFLLAFCAMLIFTEYNSAYLNDIFGVASKNPAIRNDLHSIILIVSEHMWIFLLCFTALAIVYLAGHRTLFDLAFVTGAIISSLAILDQSGGTNVGLPALIAVFLICGELVRRKECHSHENILSSPRPVSLASISVFGMLLAFASEPMLQGGLALKYHSGLTASDQTGSMIGLSGINASVNSTDGAHETLGHDTAAHALFNRLRGSRQLGAREYLPLVAEGVRLLESVPHNDHSVIAFEQTNPFPALLHMRPTRYGYPLFWANNMDSKNLPDPELYFSNADYIMVPEIPYHPKQLEKLMEVYGVYLEEHFKLLRNSPHWQLYARK